jgi:hypothetical protein
VTDPELPSPGVQSQALGSKHAQRRRGTLLQTLRAVAWAFIGIRGRGAHEADIANVNPVHLIIVAVACAGVLVATLLLIVRWAVGGAG